MATLKHSSRRSTTRRRRRRPPRAARTAASRAPTPHAAANPPAAQARGDVVDPRLHEGIELFNARRFFECHEVLESLWLNTEGRPRDFYKGLIQAAVACYHWSRQNPSGALSLYRSSNRYLSRYRPEFLGKDVDGFLERYTAVFNWLRRHHLRYDAHLVPTIRWTASIS